MGVMIKLGTESGVRPAGWKQMPPVTAEREMLPEV